MMSLCNNKYQTLEISETRGVLTIAFNRSEASNSINTAFLKEVLAVLGLSEQQRSIKVVVLQGKGESFCTGMDFKAISAQDGNSLGDEDPALYYELLKRLSLSPKVIVSCVKGKVNAGGIGIVAASDVVIAGESATFGLSEALFGLLPACVMPFLIRRVGFHKAQWLTLLTQPITAERAFQIGLTDETGPDPDELLRRNLLRLGRLENDTVAALKEYTSKLWIINDATQQLAVATITELLQSENVRHNIRQFVQNGVFPWNK